MNEAIGVLLSVAVLLGAAACVCALGDLIDRFSRGAAKGFGSFHVLAWLPAFGMGVFAWNDPATFGDYSWLYLPLLVAGGVYAVSLAYAAVWAGLPLEWQRKAVVWLRGSHGI